MSKEIFATPTKASVKWAISKEFEFLPSVDPAFSPSQLGLIRKFLLKFVVLPGNYLGRLKGQILLVSEKKVGYIFLKPKNSRLHIESMGIVQNSRRQGFGKKLIEWAEKIASEKELAYLSAAVTPENKPATKFFLAMGFQSYQPQYFSHKSPSSNGDDSEEITLAEIAPANLLEEYEKWFGIGLSQGETEVKSVIEEDFPRIGLKVNARHWTCIDDGKEIGYLRIAGLLGALDIYLVLDQYYWESEMTTSLIAKALKKYPKMPSEIKLVLGSTKQVLASKDILEISGFNLENKSRYLMIKPLHK
jgi:GNAT superfamily N-acetyltransferase